MLVDGEFKVHNRLIKRVPKSLFCLTNRNPLRKCCVWLMEWRWFDNAILVFILLNSIGMANYDYINDDALKNRYLDAIFNVFSLIFLGSSLLVQRFQDASLELQRRL